MVARSSSDRVYFWKHRGNWRELALALWHPVQQRGSMITTIAYAAVSFLIAMVSSWVGSLIALRPLGKPPPVFWVDRARLAYPARTVTAASTIVLPLIAGFMIFVLSKSLATPLTVEEIVAMGVGAYLGGIVVALRTEKRIRGAAFHLENWWRNFGYSLVVRSPQICVLICAPLLLPNSLNLYAIAILIPATLALVFGVSGGGYIIAHLAGLTRTASPRLAGIVAIATARTGIKPRVIYELKSSTASALAMPIWRRLLFTDKALEVLNDPELVAVSVHELAHLSESYRVSALRVLRGMVWLLAILVIRSVWGEFGKVGLYALLYGTLLASVLARSVTNRVARRMEVRADAAGRTHQGEDGTYARALERLYETNLVPAVMSAKIRPHPHLYDRLIAAGVTPSYPRPAPPASDRQSYATVATMGIAAVLYGIVFVILGVPLNFN